MLLESDSARVEVDLAHGGRISSLCIHGMDLIVGSAEDVLDWGCYPMAPWAGRIRQGRFEHAGQVHQLPLSQPPHAIHGTVYQQAWQSDGESSASVGLGPDWPFAGRAVQRFILEEDSLRLRLEIHSERDPFPASLGWHPWFRRRLSRGGPAELSFAPGSMYERGEDLIPTGRKVAVPVGPWDDCFVDLASAPEIRWPGALKLRLLSDLNHWVVYDEPEHAICIEPMTGPPDALNLRPQEVTPDRPLVAEFELQWASDDGKKSG